MNGIALHVGSEKLDLGEAKIRIRIQSPLFQPEFIRQSYSYPFTLPWTPTNARLFRHADRLANVENIITLQTDVYLGGLFWKTGTLHFRRYRKGFDCELLVPPDTAITAMGEMSLQELRFNNFDTSVELGAGDFDALDDRYTEQTGTYEDVRFVFAPIKNAKPLGDGHWYDWFEEQPTVPDPDPDGYVNHYDATATYKWLGHVATYPDDGELYQTFTPCIYLRPVLQAVLATQGRALISSLLDLDEFNRMVIIGNLLQVVGITTTGTTPNGFEQSYLVMNPVLGLPKMTGIEFLVAIQKRFNGRFLFGLGDVRFVTMVEVLQSTDIYDATDLVVPLDDFELGDGSGYRLDSIEDPMDALDGDRDKANDETINYTVDAFSDLAGLTPDDGEVALVLCASFLYKYNLLGGAGWEPHMPYLPGISVGDGTNGMDIGVALTRMYMGDDAINGSRKWLTPEVEMILSEHQNNRHGVGLNNLSVLRLLFYRGMQEDDLGETYPLLTNGTQDYNGDTIAGAEWCERIEGAGGIHELWYKEPERVLSDGRKVQRQVRLPLADMLRYDFARKMHIDSINYLVDAIDVEFTVDSIGVPRLDLVKV